MSRLGSSYDRTAFWHFERGNLVHNNLLWFVQLVILSLKPDCSRVIKNSLRNRGHLLEISGQFGTHVEEKV